jgi:lipoyl(octanoyl) transferase
MTHPAPDGQPVPPLLRPLGRAPYEATADAMKAFTAGRGTETPDEIWLVEHPPVFTQGLAGKAEHLLDAGDIPVVQTDRGGQVTYHGPGQIVAYVMIDLKRAGYGARSLVSRIEQAVVATLAGYGVGAYADPLAPGVYVDIDGERAKIASLGLRVRRGCSYHGLSLNADMDLSPFGRINPCGYRGLRVTHLRDFGGPPLEVVQNDLQRQLIDSLYRTAT